MNAMETIPVDVTLERACRAAEASASLISRPGNAQAVKPSIVSEWIGMHQEAVRTFPGMGNNSL